MEEEVEYEQSCRICSKLINFEQIPVPNGDEIVMFNYHTHTMPIQNVVVVLCSKECKQIYRTEICGCVVCGDICMTDRWYVHMKFVKQGGWTSIKAICSERCHKHILKHETTEIELRYACWYCKKLSPKKLKRCGKCHLSYYCNVECQQNHWKVHKLDCK